MINTVWVGDFRSNFIKNIDSQEDAEIGHNHIYFIEDTADYNWFANSFAEQLAQLSLSSTDIIIMLGFNDCVRSCVWDSFDIAKIATDYSTLINSFVEQNPSFNFYICSVNPVQAGYPFSGHPGGVISAKSLNEKISVFNSQIESSCQANKINSYKYFNDTSFITRDGVRYNQDTSTVLYNYILSCLTPKQIFSFMRRYTKTEKEDGTISFATIPPDPTKDSYLFWKTKASGGFNDCIEVEYGSGAVLPNCTGYAWGRFAEILGTASSSLEAETESPGLSTGNAGKWWDANKNSTTGYQYSETVPQPGAVICWSKENAAGHVAIVEDVFEDGTIITSESGWKDSRPTYDPDNHIWVVHRDNSDGHWGKYSDGYRFQGFIYNPAASYAGAYDYVSKDQIVSKGTYLTMQEMEINAKYIWNYLGSRGWSINAVAGILGNIQTESTFSPNLCEKSDEVASPSSESPSSTEIEDYANRYLAAHGRFPGYGLVQWTGQYSENVPYIWDNQKYIYWCNQHEPKLNPADIDSQLERIIWECDNSVQFHSTTAYPMTFKEFSVSNKPADCLAKAFLKNYERPKYPDYETRGKQGLYWYNFIRQFAPTAVKPISIENLKIDSVSPTSVSASFIMSSYTTGKVTLKAADGKTIDELDIAVEEDNKEAEDKNNANNTVENSSIDESKYLIKVEHFDSNKLTPNTAYSIHVQITNKSSKDVSDDSNSNELSSTEEASNSVNGDSTEETITFTTPQDYPKSVTNINLKGMDSKLPNKLFQLTLNPLTDNDWGFWKKPKNGGYILQLFINGRLVEELTKSSIDNTFNFELEKEFKKYKSKPGDSIQIGICTYTLDSNKKFVYNNQAVKISNSICFLKKPVQAYLNID